MDCNLQKIRDANLEQIKCGKTRQAVFQAEDYLSYVLGHNEERIQKELEEFKTNLQSLREN